MHSAIPFSLLLARLSTATFYNGGVNGSGNFYEGAYGENAPNAIPNLAPFQEAAANPNATNSVPVHDFIWRTNVSEVSVKDATTSPNSPSNGTAIANARVISTVFDLTWQGNSSIAAALQSQGVESPFGCIMMMDGLGLPENVTSKYTQADNGSCTNVLGDDCVKDFLARINSTSGECPGFPSKADLPASCAGTLGTLNTSFSGLTENLASIQGTPNLQSGQAFAHITSSAYNGTNATAALQEAESRLQILVIKGLNTMACQRVNSTLTVTTAPTPAGATLSGASSIMERMSIGVLSIGVIVTILLGL